MAQTTAVTKIRAIFVGAIVRVTAIRQFSSSAGTERRFWRFTGVVFVRHWLLLLLVVFVQLAEHQRSDLCTTAFHVPVQKSKELVGVSLCSYTTETRHPVESDDVERSVVVGALHNPFEFEQFLPQLAGPLRGMTVLQLVPRNEAFFLSHYFLPFFARHSATQSGL
jgi:hypothetical protein